MKYVKPAATVAAAIAIGSSAQAGNIVAPAMESEVVMAEETVVAGTATSGGFVVPLLLLALIAVAASSSGGGGDGITLPEE